MGKDRSKDGDAATSSTDRDHSSHANRDHSRDQEESRDAALTRTIAVAVAGALTQQKAEEAQSIAEAVALQTQSLTEAFQR